MITRCSACNEMLMPNEYHTRWNYKGPCTAEQDKPRKPNDTWEIWRFFNIVEEGP